MRPLRIEMKGFGAFRDTTTVDLTDIELVALVGPTGSGKSTVIDAITFALFGSVVRYDDNKRVGYVINQLSAEARVALTFDLDGAEHLAVRVVRRTAGGASTKEARLERGDVVLADSARDMSRVVGELLGLNVDQFNRTVVLPQGRFADFLHDDPRDRQATLRRLLGLDVYQRVGQAARARATRLGDQAEVLRGEAGVAAGRLTPDRRDALVATVTAIDVARGRLATAKAEHRELAARRTELLGAIDDADRGLGLLTGVAVPAGVDTIAARAATAGEQLAAASAAQAAAGSRRDAARAAATAGPDLTTVSLHLQHHEQLGRLRARRASLAAEVEQLAARSAAAVAAATTVHERQLALDGAAERAREVERAARAAASAVPSIAELDTWSGWHAALTAAEHELATAQAAAIAASEPLRRVEHAVRVADQHAAAAEAELAAVRDREGVLAYAHLLATGEPCPLCEQDVLALPEHHIGEAVTAATARHAAARDARRARQDELDTARDLARRAEAEVVAAHRAAERARAALAGVAPPAEIEAMRTQAAALAEAAAAAARAADETARSAAAHRREPDHVATLAAAADLSGRLQTERGRLAALDSQVTDLAATLGDAPSHERCLALRDEAVELRRALDEAEAALGAASSAAEACRQEVSAAQDAIEGCRRDLGAARDRVAALAPPSIADLDLAAGWSRLADWCHDRRDELEATRRGAHGEREAIDGSLARLLAEAAAAAASATGADLGGRSLDELGESLAGHDASARAAVARFDDDRERLAEATARIGRLDGESAVARTLGQLLQSNAFEAWLMRSALQQLVERATERLYELSGGQYSLVIDGTAFLVRDHTNADETRSTRTLSGGETFLASLSLALALSEATAELAPDGAPQIESIFLDEGFGTLDPDTLDTVATAIEELGASGRLVGIVTHIRDLADRMPVRLEVTKAAGTSRVERVEV